MQVSTGTVIAGKVVLNDFVISEGSEVYVLTRDAHDVPVLSREELAEVEAGIAEADRGDMLRGDEFFNHLRRHG